MGKSEKQDYKKLDLKPNGTDLIKLIDENNSDDLKYLERPNLSGSSIRDRSWFEIESGGGQEAIGGIATTTSAIDYTVNMTEYLKSFNAIYNINNYISDPVKTGLNKVSGNDEFELSLTDYASIVHNETKEGNYAKLDPLHYDRNDEDATVYDGSKAGGVETKESTLKEKRLSLVLKREKTNDELKLLLKYDGYTPQKSLGIDPSSHSILVSFDLDSTKLPAEAAITKAGFVIPLEALSYASKTDYGDLRTPFYMCLVFTLINLALSITASSPESNLGTHSIVRVMIMFLSISQILTAWLTYKGLFLLNPRNSELNWFDDNMWIYWFLPLAILIVIAIVQIMSSKKTDDQNRTGGHVYLPYPFNILWHN